MSGRNRFERAISQSVSRKKDKPLRFSGTLGIVTLGEETVQVPTRSNYVWVRLRNASNEVIQAFNQTVAPVYNLPVLVERDENAPNRYTVIGRDIGRYSDWGSFSAYLPAHSTVHSFNPDDPGADTVYVYSQQFMPLNPYPSGSVGSGNVIISGYTYYWEGSWRYGGGTGTANLLPLKPTDGQARLVLVYLDPNGNPAYVTGSFFSATYDTYPEILPYIPSLPETAGIPLAAIRLTSGTSVITWNDIFDLRPLIVGDGFIPTGSSALSTPAYVTMAASASLSAERVLTAGNNISITDNGANSTVVIGVSTGTFSSAGHTHPFVPSSAIYIWDNGTFIATGSTIVFGDHLSVEPSGAAVNVFVSSGSFAGASHTHLGAGGGGGFLAYDNGIFKATGTALDFGSNLIVHVTGTTVFVEGSGGAFGGSAVPIFDNSVFKVTGTAISFDSNLTVSVTGSVAYVNATGGDGSSPGEGHVTLISHAYDTATGTWASANSASALFQSYMQNNPGNDKELILYRTYLAAGTYSLLLIYHTNSSGGIVDVDIDGTEVGSWDTYSVGATWNVRGLASGISIGTSGLKNVVLRLDGKNPSSSVYNANFSLISLWRTA